MGRYNGSFEYKQVQEATRDEATGFVTGGVSADWLTGCECQIEKSVPASQKIGEDGQMYAYTYDVFIPKHFKGTLTIGTEIKVTNEDGDTDEFTIQGVDNMNRRYIEIWG